jgi:Skp family chaperone for outer membrane proteins
MTKTTLTSLGLGCAFLMSSVTSAVAQRLDMAPAAPLVKADQTARLSSAAFPDDGRIAIVNVDRVASLSGEGKAATAKLEDLRNKKSAEVSARGKEVEALQAKLAQADSFLNDAARVRLQREFERARIDFQRFTADAQAEVQEAQKETIRWFNARLFPVIDQIATEKKLWAIFNAEDALWFAPALDLTEEVAKRLDQSTVKKD